MLFAHGLNAKQVQIWIGHHSAAFTLSVYVHLLDEDLPVSPFGVPLVSHPDHGEQPANRDVAEIPLTQRVSKSGGG
ncbi:MAG: hypothetical protein QOJ13_1944 [Gaiellales bacterium]|nr:hypothetical protein [Gaiellales bacterium]